MKASDMLMVEGGDSFCCLVMTDKDYTKMVITTIGDKQTLIKKMREISEVFHVSGDKFIDDMSRGVSGYPMVRHENIVLQVIPASEMMGEFQQCDVGFFATGEHLG